MIVQVAPGARVRLAADWGKLHAGDELVVSHLDGPGLVVSPIDAKEELWIPASLIPNSSISRAWSFRPRKIDPEHNVLASPQKGMDEKMPPKVRSVLSPVKVTAGEVARLSIEVARAEGATVAWQKEGDSRDIVPSERHRLHHNSGFIYLEISRCRPSDSGVYTCNIQCENGSCSTKISLNVTGLCPQ